MDELDVVVVGGGAAGLSAGVVLGRARRSVAVVDAGQPRNAVAEGVHSFLTRDGIAPGVLLETGRAELARYGGRLVEGTARSARRTDEGFEVVLDDGATLIARALVVATGLTDELPDVMGVRERWGRDVVHCPYCHGWEVRDRAIAVLGSGPMAVHQTLLFRQWTDDLVLVQHTAPDPTAEEAAQLDARGISVVRGEVAGVEVADDRITGLRLRDGGRVDCEVVVVGPRMAARSPVLDSLGLTTMPHPMGAALGESYPAEPSGATAVAGVWLAGNVTELQAQVVTAAARGVAVAAAVNADLVAQDTARALERAAAALVSHP